MMLDNNTAVSIVLEASEQPRTAMFGAQQPSESSFAFDWLDVAATALPNAKPLNRAERESVNRFFWSQFD